MKKSYILSSIACMLLAVSYVNAQTIYPSMDTFVNQNGGGGAGTASVTPYGTTTTFEVRNSTGSANRIAFMDITVSGISSFSSVSSAILNLYLYYNSNNATGPETVQIYPVASESVTIDNNSTWTLLYPSGTQSYTLGSLITSQSVTNSSGNNNKLYSFDITSLISSLSAGTTKVTLCLKAGTNAAAIDFWSRE